MIDPSLNQGLVGSGLSLLPADFESCLHFVPPIF
jgi:hypothetical protein